MRLVSFLSSFVTKLSNALKENGSLTRFKGEVLQEEKPELINLLKFRLYADLQSKPVPECGFHHSFCASNKFRKTPKPKPTKSSQLSFCPIRGKLSWIQLRDSYPTAETSTPTCWLVIAMSGTNSAGDPSLDEVTNTMLLAITKYVDTNTKLTPVVGSFDEVLWHWVHHTKVRVLNKIRK